MNQAHKRDLILKRLYQHHKTGNTPTPILHEVMQDLKIYSKKGEDKKFVHLLSPYARINELKEGINIRLNEEGIEYVEKHLLA
jgi:hypothetical protein